jgi:hypothetical protein
MSNLAVSCIRCLQEPRPNIAIIHQIYSPSDGKFAAEIEPAVAPCAVVDTFAVCIRALAGTVHTGADVTAGVIAEVRPTSPLKDPEGMTAR